MPRLAQLQAALGDVLDPEYPLSIVDLGLVRGLAIEGRTARVDVVYCSLGCPCIELIESDVRERLLALDGIDAVEVNEVFEPWSRRDISSEGLRLLRQSGVA